MSVIRTEELCYVYSPGTPFQKTAVDHISLEIEKGEFVGVIGHTGSGKSTLIRHFNGLLKPTAGKIYLNGKDMWEQDTDIRKVRFQVGLVFQYPEYQLFEETVFKDIAFGPANMGLSEEEIKQRVYESAEFVGLSKDVMEKSPFELSGGQKRRVAIAGVFAMNPEVLILDEPTAGLDPKGREMVLRQISEYHKARGNTVLLVSHSMEDTAKYAQKVLVMNQSKIYLYDTVDNVFSHAQEIEALGLDIPQVTKIFYALKKQGLDVSSNIYTVEQGRQELLRLKQAKEGK